MFLRSEILGLLAAHDKGNISMYADLFLEYVNAQEKITEQGALVINDRNGQPMDNPYLKIRNSCIVMMGKLGVESSKLWALYETRKAVK